VITDTKGRPEDRPIFSGEGLRKECPTGCCSTLTAHPARGQSVLDRVMAFQNNSRYRSNHSDQKMARRREILC
jgi:hypothetical protein